MKAATGIAAGLGVGAAAGTAGAAAAGVVQSAALGTAAGVGAATGIGALGVGAAIGALASSRSGTKTLDTLKRKASSLFGSTAESLKAARLQLMQGLSKDVKIAGERVRLLTSGFNFKRHPDVVSINEYYTDANQEDIAIINKFFGYGSQYNIEDPKALCDKGEKAHLVRGLEHRLTTLQNEIIKFHDKQTYTVSEIEQIHHANRLISLIKKIESAKGPCESFTDSGEKVVTPQVDVGKEDRIEDIVKRFAYIVLKHIDPDEKDNEEVKRIINSIENAEFQQSYIDEFKDKPVFVQRILGLDGDIKRLLIASQEELLKKLLEILPANISSDINLDEPVDSQPPTPYDKIARIISYMVEKYTTGIAEIARLTQQINDCASHITALEGERDTALATAAAAAAALIAEKEVTKAARDDSAARTVERDAAIADAADAASTAEAAIAAANGRIAEIQAALDAAIGDKTVLEDARRVAEEAAAAAADRLKDAQAATATAIGERDAARAELAVKTTELAETQGALAAKLEELRALGAGSTADAAAAAAARSQIDAIQAQLDKATADLAKANAELSRVRADATARVEAAVADARAAAAKLREVEAERDTHAAKVGGAEGRLAAAASDIDGHKAMVNELQRKIADLEALNGSNTASSSIASRQAEDKIRELTAQLLAAKAEIDPLEARLTKALTERDAALKDAKDCSDQYDVMLASSALALDKAKGELDNERKRAQAERAALAAADSEKDAALAELRAALDEHSGNLGTQQSSIAKLEAENRALKDANTALIAATAQSDRAAKEYQALLNDLAAISRALESDTDLPRGSAQLQTIVDRINGLRGDKDAFNKNMCLFAHYVSYFMKLIFTGNRRAYAHVLSAVDKARGSGTYMSVIDKLMPMLNYYQNIADVPSQQQINAINDNYLSDSVITDVFNRTLKITGTALGDAGKKMTPNDYFTLFVVSSQRYIATTEMTCDIPDAVRDPNTVLNMPAPAAIALGVEDRDTAAIPAGKLPKKTATSAPNPIAEYQAESARRIINNVFKAAEGGSPSDMTGNRDAYIHDHYLSSKTLIDSYCSYPDHNAKICSNYRSDMQKMSQRVKDKLHALRLLA